MGYKEEVRALKEQRIRTGGELTPFEESLWEAAECSPFGGRVLCRSGDPYLLRVHLTPGYLVLDSSRIYLHYFVRGDLDPSPHNHPFAEAKSVILTGGYKEFRCRGVHRTEITEYEEGMVNQISHHTFHRIELLDPARGCWTLFVAGRRVQASDGEDWGFLDMETHKVIPWGSYKK